MTNLEILEFKQAIISYINHVQLPVVVKEMVIKEIYNEIQQVSHIEVKREFEEKQQQENADKKETE